MRLLAQIVRDDPEVQALIAAKLAEAHADLDACRTIMKESTLAAARLSHRIEFDRRSLGL